MVHVPGCPICSGRRPFCIHKSYPLPQTKNLEQLVKEKLKKDFFGPSTSVFVGKQGYPDIFAGPMLGLEEKDHIDSPQQWFGMDYSKIIELRSFLLRSKKNENIFSRSRFVEEMQQLALSHKNPDVEMNFKKIPHFEFRLSEAFQPMGPSGEMERMKVTENVRIKTAVQRIVSDDLRATEQSFLLYTQGLDVYKISSIFSSGVLGLGKNRKMVPSRWSLTGIQDIIANNLIKEIKQFSSLNEYRVYSSEFLDNHFEILLMPGNWEFENFEVWVPKTPTSDAHIRGETLLSNWSRQTQAQIIEEYEPYEGRTTYADKQAGGFYCSKLGCLEGLKNIGRQARVIGFREVYEGYTIPVGSWQILENVRNAFKQPYRKFNTKEEALAYIKSRLRVPLSEYRKQSRILSQKRIFEF